MTESKDYIIVRMCRNCHINEAQTIKAMGGICRKYNPNHYCKDCYNLLKREKSNDLSNMH